MAGLINPLVAAILMPASSITVIVSSYRARMFEPAARGTSPEVERAGSPVEKAVA
jgi:hypothetical protein